VNYPFKSPFFFGVLMVFHRYRRLEAAETKNYTWMMGSLCRFESTWRPERVIESVCLCFVRVQVFRSIVTWHVWDTLILVTSEFAELEKTTVLLHWNLSEKVNCSLKRCTALLCRLYCTAFSPVVREMSHGC